MDREKRRASNREYMRRKLADPEYRQRIAEQRRKQYAADPEYREKAKARAARLRERDSETHNAKKRALYHRDIENNRIKDRSPKRRAQVRRRYNERYATDPAFRLKRILRARLHYALRAQGALKRTGSSAVKLVGCSMDELRAHLESLLPPSAELASMEIDHIRPCASFDLTDLEQQRACFHYTNLQPLGRSDNASKTSRWNGVVHRVQRVKKSAPPAAIELGR